jgi:hypothetical protein
MLLSVGAATNPDFCHTLVPASDLLFPAAKLICTCNFNTEIPRSDTAFQVAEKFSNTQATDGDAQATRSSEWIWTKPPPCAQITTAKFDSQYLLDTAALAFLGLVGAFLVDRFLSSKSQRGLWASVAIYLLCVFPEAAMAASLMSGRANNMTAWFDFCHTDLLPSDPLYPAANAICNKCTNPSAC